MCDKTTRTQAPPPLKGSWEKNATTNIAWGLGLLQVPWTKGLQETVSQQDEVPATCWLPGFSQFPRWPPKTQVYQLHDLPQVEQTPYGRPSRVHIGIRMWREAGFPFPPCWEARCLPVVIWNPLYKKHVPSEPSIPNTESLTGDLFVSRTMGRLLGRNRKVAVKSRQPIMPKLVKGTVGRRTLNRLVHLPSWKEWHSDGSTSCHQLHLLSDALGNLVIGFQVSMPSRQYCKWNGDNYFASLLKIYKFSRSDQFVGPGTESPVGCVSRHPGRWSAGQVQLSGSQKCKSRHGKCIIVWFGPERRTSNLRSNKLILGLSKLFK